MTGKTIWLVGLCSGLLLCTMSCFKQSGSLDLKKAVTTRQERLGYALGMAVGESLKKGNAPVDLASFEQGIADGFLGRKLLLSPADAEAIKKEIAMEKQNERQSTLKTKGEKNLKIAEEFFAGNKKSDGVVTTATGLQYKILTKGTGPRPQVTDAVRVSFSAMFIDGKEWDNSSKSKTPTVYQIGNTLKGVSEALQLMPVGSTWRIFVPPALGFGPEGRLPVIEPNAALVFEIELQAIEKKPAATPAVR